MGKLIRAYQVIRHYGLGFCVFRGRYALRKKSGLLNRKFRTRRWSETGLCDLVRPRVDCQPAGFIQAHRTNGRSFFFAGDNLPSLEQKSKEDTISEAEQVLENRFRYFFDRSYSLGEEVDWFLNPVTGRRCDSSRHWCDIDVFDPEVGDIKFIWEPSRFAWVYTLVRAYGATGDNKYAEKFWQLFESWLEANQPNMGPNYACGQECAIRLMAMCFGFYGFADAPATTAERQVKLAIAIGVHAERIENNIDFAISTRTNHSLTEAAGLYTAGMLFPEFKRCEYWLKLGKRVLTKEGLKQIYPDGCYIQHSMNYHRLMLQDFLWVMRLGQLNGDTFGDELVSRIGKAVEFLYQMQDEDTGKVPNYGSNDGALIIPLNSCDYLDYRPVVQAVYYLLNGVRLYESGVWDEDVVWLFGREALEGKVKPIPLRSRRYDTGGYYTIRNKNNWSMFRCHNYFDRPAQSDMLHLDLWWRGINVLRDSGTYMYNCDEPWQSYFSSTAAHNTVVVDGRDQMTKASRFMWLDWVKSKLTVYEGFDDGLATVMQGEHYGYYRGNYKIAHRRSVLSVGDACWLIVDDVLGRGTHQVGLYWQLCDVDCELQGNTLTLQTNQGPVCLTVLESSGGGKCECFKGDDEPKGWQCLYYGNRKPAPVLVCSAVAELPVRFVTLVGPGDTIKNATLSEMDKVFWSLEVSGEEHTVVLNSIGKSDKNTFVSAQRDSEKVFLS